MDVGVLGFELLECEENDQQRIGMIIKEAVMGFIMKEL